MKIRLEYEFDLPEDREQFDIVTKANHLDYVIHELDNYLRSKIKYESQDMSEEQYRVYEEIREKLWELKNNE